MINHDFPNIAKEYKRTIAGRFMLVEGAKLKDKLSGEDFLVTKKMDGIMLVVFVRDGEVPHMAMQCQASFLVFKNSNILSTKEASIT